MDSTLKELQEIEELIFLRENDLRLIENALAPLRSKQKLLQEKVVLEMQETGCLRAECGGVSYSMMRVNPKPIIIDESAIPEDFFRVKREVNKNKINDEYKKGNTVPGVSLDNGGWTLQRRGAS